MKKILLIIVVLLTLVISGCGETPNKDFDTLSEPVRLAWLKDMSQAVVLTKIKTPSTADFPIGLDKYCGEFVVKKDGTVIYTVSSYVDAENMFGATIRSRYQVKLQIKNTPDKNGGYGYRMLSCEFY